MFKVAILGGSGYGGSELLRLLLPHPQIEIKLVSAGEHAGKRVDQVHPNLSGFTDLTFVSTPSADGLSEFDCVFLALPNGQAMDIVPAIPTNAKVIDLSGDFRINDAAAYERYYERPHTAMGLQKGFVYGLTEINRNQIREARRIANPGCFATALELGLYPFVASGMVKGKIIADMKTGSSGSGAKAAVNTHHPKRTNSFYAYKVFAHQHTPEIEQVLTAANPAWAASSSLVFQVHSLPVVRGIFASIYMTAAQSVKQSRVDELLHEFYGNEFFIRRVSGSPDINWVKTTNFVDIAAATNGDDVIVFVALDNLVKGAAGQAIQNMNLMLGLDERMGLAIPGTNP